MTEAKRLARIEEKLDRLIALLARKRTSAAQRAAAKHRAVRAEVDAVIATAKTWRRKGSPA